MNFRSLSELVSRVRLRSSQESRRMGRIRHSNDKQATCVSGAPAVTVLLAIISRPDMW